MPRGVGGDDFADALFALARMRRLLGIRSASALGRALEPLADPETKPTVTEGRLGFGLVQSWRQIGSWAARCAVGVVGYDDEVLEVTASCVAHDVEEIREATIGLLRRTLEGGFEASPDRPGLLEARFRYPDVVARADAARARVLGEALPVEVPSELEPAYRMLTSRSEVLSVGSSCGIAGTEPAGRSAMSALVASGRRDLLGNALRGPNPAGRVYGALGLLALPPVAPADADAIRALRAQPETVPSCGGCIVDRSPASALLPADAVAVDAAP